MAEIAKENYKTQNDELMRETITIPSAEIENASKVLEGVDLRETLYAKNLEKATELAENLVSRKANMGDVEQMIRFVERDMEFIEENPVNEETDARQKKEQKSVLDLLNKAVEKYNNIEARRVEVMSPQNVEEANNLVKSLFVSANLGAEEKAEIERGIGLKANLLEEDIKFIEQNGIDKEADEKMKQELAHSLNLLRNVKSMSSGVIEYARGLSRDLAAPKESDAKVEETKSRMALTIETVKMLLEEADKKRESDQNYKLEDEENIRRSVARLESEIAQ